MLRMEEIMERIDVIKRLNAGEINQKQAMNMLNLGRRQIYRLKEKYERSGAEGIQHKPRSGRPPIAEATRAEIISLVKNQYYDFGPTLACEKLQSRGYNISKETLRLWFIKDGIWKDKCRKLKVVHQTRLRRPQHGELIQIDGSHHDWFEGRTDKCCLYVFIDDATSEIKALHFAPKETTLGYMQCAYNYIKTDGRPIAFYSDKHSIFRTSRPNTADGHFDKTQFQRAINQLGIELICANSPQAKGRVERANRTLQNRLVKEMRLRNISSINEANQFLPEFIEDFNNKFAKKPENPIDAHRKLYHTEDELKFILSVQHEKIVSKNCQVYFDNHIIKINPKIWQNRLSGQSIIIATDFNGFTSLHYGNTTIIPSAIIYNPNAPKLTDHKSINIILDSIINNAA